MFCQTNKQVNKNNFTTFIKPIGKILPIGLYKNYSSIISSSSPLGVIAIFLTDEPSILMILTP